MELKITNTGQLRKISYKYSQPSELIMCSTANCAPEHYIHVTALTILSLSHAVHYARQSSSH